MPLHLTPHQRAHLASRAMLKAPDEFTTPEARKQTRLLIEKRLNGLPGDILFTLDALRLLADQGNVVAADLLDHEIERLGLTRPSHFGP